MDRNTSVGMWVVKLLVGWLFATALAMAGGALAGLTGFMVGLGVRLFAMNKVGL